MSIRVKVELVLCKDCSQLQKDGQALLQLKEGDKAHSDVEQEKEGHDREVDQHSASVWRVWQLLELPYEEDC